MTIRINCPACDQRVAMSDRGRLSRHGSPPCAKSGKHLGRIWPRWFRGRRVRVIGGPDTWNPNTLEGVT